MSTIADTGQREFIRGVLRDMRGNALLLLATGRSEPTKAAPYGKLKVNAPRWFVYPDELDAMVAFAEKAFADRVDAYISPFIYGDEPYVDSKGRTVPLDWDGRPQYTRSLSNVLYSQTVYMDSDSCPPDAFRIAPSRHVQTSEGHGHDYWFLPEPVPARLAAEVAHKITLAHRAEGTDPSGWAANKVLRLPTFNTTYDELDPYPVTWEDDDVDPVTGEVGVPKVYTIEDMQEVYADISLNGSGDYEGLAVLPPVPTIEGLPDFEELARRIPATQKRLNELLYKEPKTGPDGWRTEQRFALMLDLKRFGFTDEETIALTWSSPAGAKARNDDRGVNLLWWELHMKVLPIIARESGAGIEAAPESETALVARRKPPRLLSPAARQRVEERQDIFTLYMAYARSKVNVFNAPYNIINGWTLLSLGLGEAAELPKDPRPVCLNIYSYTAGNSSTGKDESKAVLRDCTRVLYPDDPPDVPASSSPNALVENLIARDNKVTYIQSNEADGLLAQIKSGGYTTGIMQYWTLAYDGEVPSLGRVGNKDLNKPHMHAIPTMHLMGTPKALLDILTPEMFYSGYLARQIWVIGEDHPTTRETVKSKFRRGEAAKPHDDIPIFLSAVFARLRMRLRSGIPFDRKRAPLDPTDEALELHAEAMWKIHEHFAKEHDIELWKPVMRRMADIIWKIAGLTAASHGRAIIGTFDVEVALYYAQEWIGNAITIADGVSDTTFSRICDEIEKFIAGRESRRAELGAIYRFRKGEEKMVVDRYLNTLVAQGRIEAWTASKEGGSTGFRIKERSKKT